VDFAGDRIPQLTSPACIDLHLHSTASDGECHPAQVVARAAELGLSAIALTDHDSVSGVPEAMSEGKTRNVRVIGGCEFLVTARLGARCTCSGYFLYP
jgi:predicted metal-dependent phosphoesterase TrpH